MRQHRVLVQDEQGNRRAQLPVHVLIAGTQTRATLYVTNNIGGATFPNPVPTDNEGYATFFIADGEYKIYPNGDDPADYPVEQIYDLKQMRTDIPVGVPDYVQTLQTNVANNQSAISALAIDVGAIEQRALLVPTGELAPPVGSLAGANGKALGIIDDQIVPVSNDVVNASQQALRAEVAADLARAYAVSDADIPIQGAVSEDDRGAAFYAAQSGSNVALAVSYVAIANNLAEAASDDADRAETAATAAAISGPLYADAAAGRAAVADNAYYRAVGSTSAIAIDIWQRVNSSTSTLIRSYPSLPAFEAITTTVDAFGDRLNEYDKIFSPFSVSVAETELTRMKSVAATGATYSTAYFYVKFFLQNLSNNSYRLTIARNSDDVIVGDLIGEGPLSGLQTVTVPEANSSGNSFLVVADWGSPTQFFFTTGTSANAALNRDQIVTATPRFEAGVVDTIKNNPESIYGVLLSTYRHAFEVDSADPYLKSVFERIDLFGIDRSHQHRISGFRASTAILQIAVRDTTADRLVAYLEVADPNYATLPELLFFDPRGMAPYAGGDAAARYTGVYGQVRLRRDNIVPSNIFYTYDQSQAGLNLSTSRSRAEIETIFTDDGYEEEIVAAAGELTEAVEDLWAEGPYSDPQDLAVRWCWRASPLHRIMVRAREGDHGATNLYVPHWVNIGGEGRGRTRIKSRSSALYRPNLQMHQANKLLDLTVYADAVRPAPYDPGLGHKAQYGVHHDQNNEFFAADVAGNINFWTGFLARNIDFIGGPSQDFALLGTGASSGERIRCENVRAWTENASRTAPFFASHTCVGSTERASFEFDVSWADTPPGVATVAVQSEQAGVEQCEVIINGCPSFSLVNYSGAVAGGWEGYGDYRGPVTSTVAGGGYLKFSTAARFKNTSGATIAAGTLCRTSGKNVVAKCADGEIAYAVAIRSVANNASDDFVVSRRVASSALGLGAGDGPVYVVNGVATFSQPIAGVSAAIGRAKDGVVELRAL